MPGDIYFGFIVLFPFFIIALAGPYITFVMFRRPIYNAPYITLPPPLLEYIAKIPINTQRNTSQNSTSYRWHFSAFFLWFALFPFRGKYWFSSAQNWRRVEGYHMPFLRMAATDFFHPKDRDFDQDDSFEILTLYVGGPIFSTFFVAVSQLLFFRFNDWRDALPGVLWLVFVLIYTRKSIGNIEKYMLSSPRDRKYAPLNIDVDHPDSYTRDRRNRNRWAKKLLYLVFATFGFLYFMIAGTI